LRDRPRPLIDRKVDDALRVVGLGAFASAYPGQLCLADKIVVMGAGREDSGDAISVKLPQPRDRGDPNFVGIREQLLKQFNLNSHESEATRSLREAAIARSLSFARSGCVATII
jgi:hypothetical protein